MEKVLGLLPVFTYVAFLLAERLAPARPLPPVRGWFWKGLLFFLAGGGRERKTGGSAERARVNVQRRISDALTRIEEACPALSRRLSRAIRTGAFCTYEPD